jgi:tRNA A37 threonylcarbamoyladenosine synthetase subunit TsaC/SUA5/YrdC
LPTENDQLSYLHRGSNSLAIRLPDNQSLRAFLLKTGPIVATSVNRSGQPFLKTIDEIKRTIPGLDFYIEGPATDQPSRLVRLGASGELEWLSR